MKCSWKKRRKGATLSLDVAIAFNEIFFHFYITKTPYNMQRILLIFFAIWLFFSGALLAQPSLQKLQTTLQTEKQNTANSFYRVEIDGSLPFIGNLYFSDDMQINTANTAGWLKQKMVFRDNVDYLQSNRQPDSYFGAVVTRYQQYFKGIKVMYGTVVETAISGQVASLQLELALQMFNCCSFKSDLKIY